MRHWGKHLLINAYQCDKRLISNPRNIEMFLQDMVKKIDMVSYGPARLAHFGTDNKLGWTAVQLIETSNLTFHGCEETGDSYIDVFSCKTFDVGVASDVVKCWFKPTLLDIKVIMRQAGERME
jgi:S-adenosylmethionine/arginine decarboxylase-like enzyme